MPILVEINASKEVVWKDGDVVWHGTAAVEWKDQEGDSTLYLSLEHVPIEHFYKGWIESFASPQYRTAREYGGFVEIGFGMIIFSPDAFGSNWPPPKTLTIVFNYTDTNETAAVLLFSGDIYLNRFDEESISYDIKAPKYTERLLDVGADYDGDTVPYPKAFGAVTHVEPLKIADNASRPTFHLGGLGVGSVAFQISSFDSHTAGTATKITTAAAHGYANAQSKTIAGTVNFDGSHTISNVTATTFTIPVAFPTDNSETLPIHAMVFTSGGFAVYDDGVPIQSNVVVNGDGSFSLTASPVGTVTISGTAAQTDLEGVMSWGKTRLRGVNAISTTYQRGTSPAISYWATDQMPLIDFLSDICAFFTHYFYIRGGTLTLGDMLIDAGSETLTEHQYLKASYSAQNAVNQIEATWQTHIAVNGFVDEVKMAQYIKEIENMVVESLYTISSGTTDGTLAMQLVDSGATFDSDGVKVGHVAQNTTDDTYSVVVAVSGTAIELEDDIFISGETYVVGPSFPYGQEISVEPYHDTKSNVSTALQNILSVLSKDIAEVSFPINDALPLPGKKLTFLDTALVVDTSTWIRARDIVYDFDNDEVIITGEGVIS